MATTAPTSPGLLTGKRIGILLENDFVEEEIAYYRRRFREEGAEVVLLTRLWGHPELTFTGHEQRAPLTVDGDLESLGYDELARFHALVVPAGMVADRLRYTENVDRHAPAVELMRRAFRIPRLLKAFSCHGLWLVSAVPELVRGRPVTCHNNLVGDVRNMGAHYRDQDVVVDTDLITSRTVDHCHLLARAVIDRLGAPRALPSGQVSDGR
ncbi:DJ-1/PfpI family protein [Thermobifida cellulosilytica]|uniref:Thiamine biosynthesis protein ThiJ n=1 Tax=Thermobifida cellulosilytica TB100 TaxID=665004 RepID=A0A147KMQ5_THECS|nr:DJ-1/PfpI family protein [Thermobifida cellulosilytica]KUP98594.1 thiamine biosynthesis protein ThiJ [Thermobifida cellulosilytica TB100]